MRYYQDSGALIVCEGGGATVHDVKIEQHVHIHIHLGDGEGVKDEEQSSLLRRIVDFFLPRSNKAEGRETIEIIDPRRINEILEIAAMMEKSEKR